MLSINTTRFLKDVALFIAPALLTCKIQSIWFFLFFAFCFCFVLFLLLSSCKVVSHNVFFKTFEYPLVVWCFLKCSIYRNKGGKFLKKLWFCIGREYNKINCLEVSIRSMTGKLHK